MEDTLLEVRDLQVEFSTKMGIVRVLDKVNLKVDPRQTVGIIGESGCGKSMMALSIMGLVPIPPGRIAGGEILYRGTDLLTLEKDAILDIRGKRIAMIFQEPMNSLNPVFTVGNQLVETLLRHEDMTRRDAWDKSVDMLKAVGIPSPEKRMHDYSFQMSGGMRQRVMIAMALACSPKLIIADEPTTALDVTIQAQILDLLRNLKDQINSSIMFITHDLGVIAEMADYVVVMYAGRIVEQGTAEEIFAHPAHPYTIGLMASKPVVGRQVDKLYSIPGKVPNPINMPNYCYFKDRCEMCVNGCEGDYPHEVSISPTHKVSCYRYYDGKRPDLEEVVEEELAEGKENGKEGE